MYDAHASLVFSLCVHSVGDRHDAEDCTQQVFTRAWRARESFDPTRPLGAWLTGITRRVLADFHAARDKQRRTAAAVSGDVRTAGRGWSEDVVQRVVVHHALARLKPPQDRILTMVFIQDLPQREVAERLGMPLGTVKSHLHRGLAKLRQLLEVNGG